MKGVPGAPPSPSGPQVRTGDEESGGGLTRSEFSPPASRTARTDWLSLKSRVCGVFAEPEWAGWVILYRVCREGQPYLPATTGTFSAPDPQQRTCCSDSELERPLLGVRPAVPSSSTNCLRLSPEPATSWASPAMPSSQLLQETTDETGTYLHASGCDQARSRSPASATRLRPLLFPPGEPTCHGCCSPDSHTIPSGTL